MFALRSFVRKVSYQCMGHAAVRSARSSAWEFLGMKAIYNDFVIRFANARMVRAQRVLMECSPKRFIEWAFLFRVVIFFLQTFKVYPHGTKSESVKKAT